MLGMEIGMFQQNIQGGKWGTDDIIPADIAEVFAEQHRNILKTCRIFGLPVSAKSCEEIIKRLESDSPKVGKFSVLLGELQKRMEDEFEAQLFLYLPPDDASLYQKPFNDWDNTLAKRQVLASFDIEEGSKCLALHRGTACVYHMMRLMEIAVKDIADALMITLAWDDRSWGKVLNLIKTELDARNKSGDAAWVGQRVFFEDAFVHLNAVKVAWRNPTMHVDKKYDPDRASEIYDMVRIFMEHLYTTLS
jgi:hypothetical protein